MTDQVQERLARLSPEQRALVFEKLQKRRLQTGSVNGTQALPIAPVNRAGPLPLSFAQQRLWFLDQLGSGSAYNISAVLHLEGELNRAALERSLNEIVRRHESLRTNFVLVNSEPAQLIAPAPRFQLPLIDLTQLPADQQAMEVQSLTQAEAGQLFNLSKDLLLRSALLRLGSEKHVLLLTLHHIAADGWSFGVFVSELTALYPAFIQNQPSPLPDLAIQYADFAQWQRQQLQGPFLAQQLAYWKQQLAGAPPLLALPTDHVRPASETFHGSQVMFKIDAELTRQLRQLSGQAGTTLFMTLLAAFQVLLARYSGQEDLVVGSPIANRTRPELESLIGFFVNTLALRVQLTGNPTFFGLLEQVRQVTQTAYEHQDLPFERLVEELQPARVLNYNPLVQVIFALQNSPSTVLTLAGLQVSSAKFVAQQARFDLEVHLRDEDDYLAGYAIYNTALFDASTIQRMMNHFQQLLANIIAQPNRRIAELSLLTPTEARQILVEWNNPVIAAHQDSCLHQCLHHWFEAQVERTPDAVAVTTVPSGEIEDSLTQAPVATFQSLTYQQLNQRANQLAHHLQSLGVRTDTLVGLCTERSLEMVIGILGVLKAGGAYVPLDPTYPKERLAFMLEDTRAPVILTQPHLIKRLPSHQAILVAVDAGAQVVQEALENPTNRATATSLAYVMYTSGSTGQPKGVMVEHRNVLALLQGFEQIAPAHHRRAGTLLCPYSFDVSVWEIFSVLCFGGMLHILSPEIYADAAHFVDYLIDHEITSVYIPPQLLSAVIEAYEQSQQRWVLERLLVGVEPIKQHLLERWRKATPQLQIVNGYGPTECTVCSTFYRFVEATDLERITPIGRAVAGYQVYVLDDYQQVTPVGVTGEIFIGGAGVGRGYHNRPELTKARFINNPFGAGQLYKTGDLARWLPDGNIEFLGRLDYQVKLRGFRIELGEIEAVLHQHPAVREAVVTMQADQAGKEHLIAYVTARQLDEQIATEHMAQWQSLYEETYRQPPAQPDLTFNITGWNSSYTNLPIAAVEMQEWVEATLQELRALHPTRVLEIGCGSGLLLARLAPNCVEYWGTDYAAGALEQVQRLKQTSAALGHVTLTQRMADDFVGIAPAAFDLVILNSVVQYFPSVEYLVRVLEGAVRVVKPNGFIYIGDVRDFALLAAYHASVQTFQAPAELNRAELWQRVQQHVLEEEELLLDPTFFGALQSHLPQIKQVQIQLKRGRHHNELTRFRYQVILQIGPEMVDQTDSLPLMKQGAQIHRRDHQTPNTPWLDWQQAALTLATLRNRLNEQPIERLEVRNIPNARLQAEALILAWLASDHEETIAQLRHSLTSQQAGVDPEALWALESEFPYAIELRSSASDPLTMDVRFSPITSVHEAYVQPAGMSKTPRIWSSYANNPLLGKLNRTLAPQLRGFLQAQLPAYMQPAAFVLLDAFPLTPNGKIDRQALPAPTMRRTALVDDYIPPRTVTEKAIAQIWCEVMNIEQIGVNANFFEIGGHSLLATQIALRIRQTFSFDLPLRTLFECVTVGALAARLDDMYIVLKLQSGAEDDEEAQEEIVL